MSSNMVNNKNNQRAKRIRKKPTDEVKVYGWNACLALYERRPDDIIRVYIQKDRLVEVKKIAKFCAENKRAYHVVSRQELEDITHAAHHEGLAMIAKSRQQQSYAAYLKGVKRSPARARLLVLDEVMNPHNIGAILRTAAHFGFDKIIACKNGFPNFSPSMMRIAEGGFEYVDVMLVEALKNAIQGLKANGFQVVVASAEGKTKVADINLEVPTILIMGNERNGVSGALRSVADYTLAIAGTGHVESLNVSVSAGILMASLQ
jgi:RNA methyltransferase, TrmH family